MSCFAEKNEPRESLTTSKRCMGDMLYQASTPRHMINMLEYPEHIVIFTLRRHGVSEGQVLLSYHDNFEDGVEAEVPLTFTRQIPIGEFSRAAPFEALEYVVPFWDLADRHGRRGASSGFSIQVRSAYRAGAQYLERRQNFWTSFPVNGGGVVRFGGMPLDIANPTLNPRAPLPLEGPDDESVRDTLREEGDLRRTSTSNLSIAYNRVHTSADRVTVAIADRLRASRVANFNLQEVHEPTESPAAQLADVAAQGRLLAGINANKHVPAEPPKYRPTRFERMSDLDLGEDE